MLWLRVTPVLKGYKLSGAFCTFESLPSLKVTYHCSKTSSTPLFLNRFTP